MGDSRNVRRCFTMTGSSIPVNTSRLPTPSKQHLHDAAIVRKHDTIVGTTAPISRIFNRFRNTSRVELQSNSIAHIDMLRNAVTSQLQSCCIKHPDTGHIIIFQPPVTTLNHAYLCLDVRDCVVRPEIIKFSNIYQENRWPSHLDTDYSRGHATFAHNEDASSRKALTPNVRKRKNPQPLATPSLRQTSSNRNIKR